VFEYLEGCNHVKRLCQSQLLKTLCKDIFTVKIIPLKVKALVAHHTDKNTVSGSKVEACFCVVEERKQQGLRKVGICPAAGEQPNVQIGYGFLVGTVKPSGLLGLHKATRFTFEIVNQVVLLKDMRAEKKCGASRANFALHVTIVDGHFRFVNGAADAFK